MIGNYKNQEQENYVPTSNSNTHTHTHTHTHSNSNSSMGVPKRDLVDKTYQYSKGNYGDWNQYLYGGIL